MKNTTLILITVTLLAASFTSCSKAKTDVTDSEILLRNLLIVCSGTKTGCPPVGTRIKLSGVVDSPVRADAPDKEDFGLFELTDESLPAFDSVIYHSVRCYFPKGDFEKFKDLKPGRRAIVKGTVDYHGDRIDLQPCELLNPQ